jgi:hypothetical protein
MAEVYRYPLKAFTDQTDYLQIDVVKYTPIRRNNENGSFSGQARSRNVNQGKDRLDTILLPMPNEIKDSNAVGYETSDLNSIAGAALGGIMNTMESGKNFEGGFVAGGQSVIDNIIKGFENTSAAAGGLSGAQGFITRRLASSAVNFLGANITARQILARGTGEILNPNTEVLFNGVKLRKFGFSFKMIPRSEPEGQEIKKIIRAFKYHSAAKLGSAQPGITDLETFIRTPHIFELRYRKGGGEHPYLHKFKQCFLESVDVSYTGEAGYATYEDGTPTSINMSLRFLEIEPIYDKDQEEYFNGTKEGVGF